LLPKTPKPRVGFNNLNVPKIIAGINRRRKELQIS